MKMLATMNEADFKHYKMGGAAAYPHESRETIAALNTPIFPQRVADEFNNQLTDIGGLNLLGVGLQICSTDAAITLCHAALSDWCVGRPQAPFWLIADEARNWAALASTQELKFYCAATFNALSASNQKAFVQYSKRLAA